MNADERHRRDVAADAITKILRPMGFVKTKLRWRRRTEELVQEFLLDKLPTGKQFFSPEWGMSFLSGKGGESASGDEMDARWMMGGRVGDVDLAVKYRYAFKFGDPPSEEELNRPSTIRFSALAKAQMSSSAEEAQRRYDVAISDEERARRISEVVTTFAVPCFTTILTRADLLAMCERPHDHRLHPTLMGGIPSRDRETER